MTNDNPSRPYFLTAWFHCYLGRRQFDFTAVRILQHPAEAGDIVIGLAGSGISTHLKARNILCVGKAFEEI